MTQDQQELRAERQAICAADHVPQEEIEKIFKRFPELYGIADYEEKQTSMFTDTQEQAL